MQQELYMKRFLCSIMLFFSATAMEISYFEKIDQNGNTPLLSAASNNNLELMHSLVAQGAQVNYQKNNGITALLLAIQHANLSAVQLLLAHGANPNIATTCASGYQGKTPLLLAISITHAENSIIIKKIIAELIDAGADPMITDCHGFGAHMHIQRNFEIRPTSEKRFEALSRLVKEKLP